MVVSPDLLNQLQADDPEERQIISGVSWAGYEALLNELGDSLRYRVTYLDGMLELLSPSRRHERNKTIIGSLLEAYCQENRIRYFPTGSTTFRQEEKRGGLEPDESYCIGTDKDFPDLAIELCSHCVNEIVVSSGGLNKLEVYRRLQVQEVWFFKNNQFEVHHLRGDRYEQISQSEVLPELELAVLAEYAVAPDPLDAAIEFREKMSKRKN